MLVSNGKPVSELSRSPLLRAALRYLQTARLLLMGIDWSPQHTHWLPFTQILDAGYIANEKVPENLSETFSKPNASQGFGARLDERLIRTPTTPAGDV
ncbi:hypothetical protein HGP16_26235 [Rhizobium sp. P40RR-XXII]|uniref:hypothetical protein n=1 Tax=Rhizobium sp. P40RR-XXII TaxID=2726739 RepID=UPI001456F2E2|nr:hypothetical protein [Rhizobium sp. P40RR-XXII]NLS20040.1 hypothetical protein [Rhizobium sp. P40RR-XXII]